MSIEFVFFIHVFCILKIERRIIFLLHMFPLIVRVVVGMKPLFQSVNASKENMN